MSIEIVKQESSGFFATEKLWLAADQKTIVHDGDARAATLLVVKGGHIGEKQAKRLGLEKGIKIEPLMVDDTKPLVPFGGGEQKMKAGPAIAPETIDQRSTRPESPPAKR